MPSIVKHHGREVVRARVTVKGITRSKKYPDSSRKSFRAAITWEENERENLKQELTRDQTVSESISIKNWAAQYLLEAKARFVKKTFQEKHFAFKQLSRLDFIKPDTTVYEITPAAASKLFQFIKINRSGNCANKVRKNLGRAWAWGADTWRRAWPEGPNPFLTVPKMPEERTARYVPSLNDFWKVHAAADNLQDRTMLITFIQTGARRGEVFKMKISDLDFSEETVRLWTRKRAGGSMEYDIIPMTKTLKSALLEWISVRIAVPGVEMDHVFICLDDNPFTRKYYKKPFTERRHLMKKLCERADVKYFGFHAIRHLTAVQLYEQKVPVKDIQLILRHRSATTTDRYLKSLGLIQEKSRAALNRIGSRPGQIIDLEGQKKIKKGPEGRSRK